MSVIEPVRGEFHEGVHHDCHDAKAGDVMHNAKGKEDNVLGPKDSFRSTRGSTTDIPFILRVFHAWDRGIAQFTDGLRMDCLANIMPALA